MTRRTVLSLGMLAAGATLLAVAAAHGSDAAAPIRNGGTFRITVVGATGNVDPALVDPDSVMLALLDATCAHLLMYPDRKPPRGYRVVKEVAKRYGVSRDGKTYTFHLRRNYRFNDGTRVRASAFAWALTRTLRLEALVDTGTNGGGLIRDIVGAKAVAAGRARRVTGITAKGDRLVIRLTAPDPSFPARMTSFCAVPPNMPLNPEGEATFPAAGPYFVKTNVRGRRIVLEQNPYYHGARPRHVAAFDVRAQATSFDDVLDRVERSTADWGWAPPAFYWDAERGLKRKYGINKSRFWSRPGLLLTHYALNTRRRLFRGNARLRRAVSYAVDRRAVRREVTGFVAAAVLADQYLPPGFPGFRNAHIVQPAGNVRKAKRLAAGRLRSGKALLYTINAPRLVAAAQVIKRNLARIGLDVDVRAIPGDVYYYRLADPDEPWDIALAAWYPTFVDPFSYLNEFFDAQFIGVSNLARFDVPRYNRLLRQANRRRGDARYEAYGNLDVRLAKEAVPSVPVFHWKEPTLVSKRVDPRCLVLRPSLDLTAVCLKR